MNVPQPFYPNDMEDGKKLLANYLCTIVKPSDEELEAFLQLVSLSTGLQREKAYLEEQSLR